MPLVDHFHEPWLERRPWVGFFSAWVCEIARQLNTKGLPAQMVALPYLDDVESFEVRVYRDKPDQPLKVRGVVAFVTPVIKDNEEDRDQLLARMRTWLQNGVGIVLVDLVTAHKGNLHQLMIHNLTGADPDPEASSLYAMAYRAAAGEKGPSLDVWDETLELGKPLPTLPLWIGAEKGMNVNLERTWKATCDALRTGVDLKDEP